MKNLEKRLYFFVPYNISPIQQAIQAGHAALQYAREYADDLEYRDFVDNWKTWIILNGGTTNSGLIEDAENGGWCVNPVTHDAPYLGSLDNIAHQLIKNKIKYSLFNEPDLNNALTAVCFIADERVWNYKDYPDLVDYIANTMPEDDNKIAQKIKIGLMPIEEIQKEYFDDWYEWNILIGGEKNIFLRELIRGKKLA